MGRRTQEQLEEELANIPDVELYKKCRDILSSICQHGMRKFTMSVPVMPSDSDMLLGEIMRRFKEDRNIKTKTNDRQTI